MEDVLEFYKEQKVPHVGERLVRKFFKDIKLLSEQPDIGRIVPEFELKYLREWNEKRRKVAKKYRILLRDVEQIILPYEMDYAKHVYHLFVVQVKSDSKKRRFEIRDKLRNFLDSKGIATGLHYPIPLHLQECFKKLGYKQGDFPVCEQLADQGLSLPIFPEIMDEQIEYVANSIKEFFK